ncbi:MAG: hypothetical protein ACOYIS_04215 [Candidatus Cloacimonadaceae bacterium]|jgi:pectin methylesterase-like acyl-CoA thioesterase
MKRYISLVVILLPLICSGITRQVALDGSQTYTSIQAAINNAVGGDMILVYPGRYLENLDLSNKSDLILTSLEYTTADTSYISSTIIYGSKGNTSTILTQLMAEMVGAFVNLSNNTVVSLCHCNYLEL